MSCTLQNQKEFLYFPGKDIALHFIVSAHTLFTIIENMMITYGGLTNNGTIIDEVIATDMKFFDWHRV